MSSDENAQTPAEANGYSEQATAEKAASAKPASAPKLSRTERAAAAKAAEAAAEHHTYPDTVVIEPMTPSRSFWTRIDKPFVFGLLVTLGALTAILFGVMLANLATVLIYIALAAFGALGLDPAVRMLERRGMPRGWGVLTVILSLLALIVLVLWLIVPVIVKQITLFITSIPGIIRDFQTTDLYASLQKQFGDQVGEWVKQIQGFLTDPGTVLSIGGGALQVGTSIATGISGMIIVLVLMLYFVAGLPSIKTSLLRLAPARDRARAGDITDQITDSVGGYIMGMVVLAFANSMVTLALFFFLGLPFPPLMAAISFLFTLIPLIGSVLFWIVGSVIALFSNPLMALVFAACYLVYMQIEAYYLTPKVMNRAVAVPGALVVIGAMAGGTLLGLLGALVAVPVTASILIIIKQIWIPRQDARS
ncbi:MULTISPECIES: AI-2E family transporter [unclassified Microbacterium]|uniref:AI-2E family transporter n=1 Tax=unclassified Microbacterium TaxID=2609290 RepID=UPI0012FCACC5|nr:AI-2E family transporter [Microbacterium sp. MAH-37]MVQ41295.1 AI-2E family transporter [Microbacterium sp. MAH-37]